jgi:creatinine amidohydrolase/Fe(II)-dependent formamide hydrolase-like protein
MPAVLWNDLTPDVLLAMRAEGLDLALWPIGGLTPPAAGLPFGLGTRLAESLCHAVSATTGTPVLPTLPFGVPVESSGVAPKILLDFVESLLASVGEAGFNRIVIVNGVAINVFALETAAQSLRLSRPNHQVWVRNLWQVTPAIERVWSGETAVPEGAAPAALGHFLYPRLVPESSLDPAGVTPNMGSEFWDVLVSEWTRFVKRALIEGLKAAPEPTPAPPVFRAPGPATPEAGLFRRPSETTRP